MIPGFYPRKQQRSGKDSASGNPQGPKCCPSLAFAHSPSTWRALPGLLISSYSHLKAQLICAPEPSMSSGNPRKNFPIPEGKIRG